MSQRSNRACKSVGKGLAPLAALAILACGPGYDATLVPVTMLPGTRDAVNAPKVARRGDVLYLCDDNLGLSLWDISKPAEPTRIAVLPDRYDNIYKMEIEGHFLHVLAQVGPTVYDIAEPRSPRVVVPGLGVRDVAVFDDQLFTASFLSGVSYSARSDRAVWHELTQGDTLAALARVGEHSLLAVGRSADDVDNFVVWEVSAGAAPRQLYAGRVEGMLDDVAVLGNIAYIAAPDRGVLVYDLSNPSAPALVTRLSSMVAFSAQVDPESRQLLVQSNSRAVYVLDLADPRAPRARAVYETSAAGIAAAPLGHIVVGNFSGVEMMRLTPR